MTQLVQTINRVKLKINPNLKIDGVLLTLADMKTKMAKTTIDTLRENYGNRINVYNTIIPLAIKAAEGSVLGKSVYAVDKNSKPALAYKNLTKEVLDSGEKRKAKIQSTECR